MSASLTTIFASGIYDSREKYPDKTRTEFRVLKNYEIELFLEDAKTAYINRGEYEVRAGNILVARPSDRRRSRLPFRCYYIPFYSEDEELVKALSALPHLISAKDTGAYVECFERIHEYMLSVDGNVGLLAMSELLRLIYMLTQDSESADESAVRASAKNHIQNAMKFIDEHYSRPITVADIAAHCHVSESYLFRTFMFSANDSPHAFLQKRRLLMAKHLLTYEDMSVSKVAERCGFTSQAYFCYSFKKSFGISPSAFRNKAQHE